MSLPTQELPQDVEEFPIPEHTLEQGGHTAHEAADFVIAEVTDTITKVCVGHRHHHTRV